MNPRYYVSVCPDTNRVFICEVGVDNNLAEVFARHDRETALERANFICAAINNQW